MKMHLELVSSFTKLLLRHTIARTIAQKLINIAHIFTSIEPSCSSICTAVIGSHMSKMWLIDE